MRLFSYSDFLKKTDYFATRHALPFWVRLLIAYMFFFFLFSAYFLLPSFTSLDDQFFNIKFAELIRERGMDAFLSFDWFSGVGLYAWHANILFYLSLIPFTFLGSLALGIKLYVVASLSLVFCVLYYFFSVLRVRFALACTFAVLAVLFVSRMIEPFLVARAFVILPAILLFEMVLLLRKRYTSVAILTFLYFFWHSATIFFPLALAGGYFGALVLGRKSWSYWIILSPLFGIICAVLIGEFFFPRFIFIFLENLIMVWNIVIDTGLSKQPILQVGAEVYPINFFDLYGLIPILMILFVFFVVRDGWGYLIRSSDTENSGLRYDVVWGTLFIMSTAFLLGSLITKRMVVFFCFFSSAFLVYCLRPYIDSWNKKTTTAVAVGVVIFVSILTGVLLAGDRISQTRRYTSIQGSAEWLVQNSEQGAVVFNPTINYFPTFFFFNQYHNRFIVGIEPRMLHDANPERYWLWYHLSNHGSVCRYQTCDTDVLVGKSLEEQGVFIAHILQTEFSAQFVIISREFNSFLRIMNGSSAFQRVYVDPIDEYYEIYRVHSE